MKEKAQAQSVYIPLLDYRLCVDVDDDEAVSLAAVSIFQLYAVCAAAAAGLHSDAGAGRRVLLVCVHPEFQTGGVQDPVEDGQRNRDLDSDLFHAEGEL